MAKRKKFTFIDLFAGLGGFHIAMDKLGGKCVFASELDPHLRNLYDLNFYDDSPFISGDIHKVQTESIPKHDVLCAGFPCQPFSQAGKRNGLNDLNNGNHFYKIQEILDYHKPKYFILENVPNLKSHDNGKTWDVIEKSLSQLYNVYSGILNPTEFGIPQNRRRFYIVGMLKEDDFSLDWTFPKPKPRKTTIKSVIGLGKDETPIIVKDTTRKQLDTWQEFLEYFEESGIPKFPIWASEFGADYPYIDESPKFKSLKSFENFKGSFGIPINSWDDFPIYARRDDRTFPQWKKIYIRKNRELWDENKEWLSGWVEKVKDFEHSHQKFEWNAGDNIASLKDRIIQFRPSGIRVKRNNASPALVLIGTQIPIVWDSEIDVFRYISCREAARLQSFPEEHILPNSRMAAFRALGNAVNSHVVESIMADAIRKIK